MSPEPVDVAFSFLVSGPDYSLRLPVDFGALPDLEVPIANGIGSRTFVFVPSQREPTLGTENSFVQELEGTEGRTVELWESNESPLQWWLRWSLANGAIHTHVREYDTMQMAETTAASVTIADRGPTTAPVLLLSPPLAYSVSRAPGYGEVAIFYSTVRGRSVALQRPSFLAEGTIMEAPPSLVDENTVLIAGAADDIEVKVTSPDDKASALDILEPVLESLANS
ncbi:MAG: hypothetical protein WD739_11150 [Actinomycetota bacterium]